MYGLIRDPSGDGDCAAYGNLQENGLRASRERDCPFACADQSSRGGGDGAQIKALEAEKADLQAEKPDQAAKHDEDYKGIWGLYNEGLDRTCSSTSK